MPQAVGNVVSAHIFILFKWTLWWSAVLSYLSRTLRKVFLSESISYRQFSAALNKVYMFFEDLLTSLYDIIPTQNVLVFSIKNVVDISLA